MGFLANQTIREGDFLKKSTRAGTSADNNKVVLLETVNGQEGQIAKEFMKTSVKFGGTGSDGALAISSGTTNIDLGGAQVVVKNYTSISITGTGKLTFTNPHANGTVIILKSQGDVTLTSSGTPNIDASALGATGGGAAAGSGVGGRGGGALYIECGGSLNFTGTIYAKGQDGTANTGANAVGGNGGGGGGMVVVLYNNLTANSGTITVTAGATSASQGGSVGPTNGTNGTNSYGIYGQLNGGNGGNVTNTSIPTSFGITPSLNTISSKYIPLMPGAGGGGGGYSSGTLNGSVGSGMGSAGAGVSIIGLNTEFA